MLVRVRTLRVLLEWRTVLSTRVLVLEIGFVSNLKACVCCSLRSRARKSDDGSLWRNEDLPATYFLRYQGLVRYVSAFTEAIETAEQYTICSTSLYIHR